MRFFLAGGLMHLFYAAAYGILSLPLAAVSDSDKPLTEYTLTVWTHKEGLPSAFIYSLAQTEDGYLWLATTDGLVRFDGVRFVQPFVDNGEAPCAWRQAAASSLCF